ncbi:MAG: hypothetical protein DI538_31240, partial [Azospira oryzae]
GKGRPKSTKKKPIGRPKKTKTCVSSVILSVFFKENMKKNLMISTTNMTVVPLQALITMTTTMCIEERQ